MFRFRTACSYIFALVLLTLSLVASAQKLSFKPGFVTLFGGDPTGTSVFDPAYSGNPLGTTLMNPYAVFIDANDNVYFVEQGGGVVRVIVATPGTVPLLKNVSGQKAGYLYQVAGNGNSNQATGACATSSDPMFGEDCPATEAAFSTFSGLGGPGGLAVDANGNVYVADVINDTIRVVYAGGSIPGLGNKLTFGNIYRVAGQTGVPGASASPIPALNAKLNFSSSNTGSGTPNGMDVDASGNLYFADTFNQVVRVLYAGGTVPGITSNPAPVPGTLYTIAGQLGSKCADQTSTVDPCGDSGTATDAYLNAPGSVKLDSNGNIFVTDINDYELRVVYKAGKVAGIPVPGAPALVDGDIYTVVGNGNSESTPADGVAAVGVAALSYATGQVFIDAAGDIFLADTGTKYIRQVTHDGLIHTISGNVQSCNVATDGQGDGCNAFAVLYNAATGLVANSAGQLLIADSNSSNIIHLLDFGKSGVSYGYGLAVVGQPTATEIVTITNTAQPALDLTSISSPTGGFAVVPSGGNDCTASTSLAQGQSCEIGVILAGQPHVPANGGLVTGSILVDSNAVNANKGANTIALDAIVVPNGVNMVLTASSVNLNANQPVTFTAVVTPMGGGNSLPTGTVDFTVTTFTSGGQNNTTYSAVLNAQGVATYTIAAGLPPAPFQAYNVQATYNEDPSVIPDPDFFSGTSNTLNVAVSSLQVPTVSIHASASTISPGQSVTLTATVKPYSGSVVPTGTITFSNGVSMLPGGTVPLTGGSATFTFSGLKAGTNILVANYNGDTNYLYARSPGTPVTVTGTPTPVAKLSISPGIISTIYTPATGTTPTLTAVVLSPSGDIYFADASDDVVYKLSAGGGSAKIVAGAYGMQCSSATLPCGDGGPAASALLNTPNSLALDAYGNLFIDDGNDYAIRRVGLDGIIQTVAGTIGSPSPANNNQLATSAGIDSNIGMAINASGDLYLVERSSLDVRVVSASTGIISYANLGPGLLVNGVPQAPEDLAIDANGNLFIATSNNIFKVDAKTSLPSVIAGTGMPCTAAPCGDGGPAIQAFVGAVGVSSNNLGPYGPQVDAAGNLYFADSGNNVVRKIDAAGTITTVAGNYTAATQGNANGEGGLANNAQLNNPVSISFDTAGDLYLADQGDYVLRKVSGRGTTINFGALPLGSDPVVPVFVSNTGGAPLTFTGLDFPANDSFVTQQTSHHQYDDCDASTQLAPGATCAVNVQFFPTQTGPIPPNTSIKIASNSSNASSGVNAISLQGSAIPAGTGTASQTITFSQNLPSSVTYGTKGIMLSATTSGTASANDPLPIQYRVTGPALVENTSGGQSLLFTGIGIVTVTAFQPGNGVYAAAASTPQTITVQPAILTVTADSQARKIDTPNPPLTYSITPNPLFNGDTLQGSPSLTTTATQSSPGGFYPIVITQGSLTFPDAYTLNLVNGTLQVVTGTTPQTITSFPSITNAIYGGTVIPMATASSGLGVTYTTQGPLTPSGNGFVITGVGQATLTANQFGNSTYAPATPVSQTFTIAQAPLTITANNVTVVQGNTQQFSYTASGLVNGDTQSAAIRGQPNYVVAADSSSLPGTYRIGISQGTLSAINYNLSPTVSTYVPGTLTILAGASQTITFPPIPNVSYGAPPIVLQATSSSGLPITYSVSAANQGNALKGSTIAIGAIGTVSVTASQSGGPGYSAATPVTQTFTVLPVPLTVAPMNQTEVAGMVTLAFEQQGVPPVIMTGLVNGDTPNSLLNACNNCAETSPATVSSPPGTYPIVIPFPLGPGASYGNYAPVTVQTGTLTIVLPSGAPDYTLTSNAQSVIVPRGSLRAITVYLSPVNDYQGTVQLSCGTLPAGVTCTFDPNAFTLVTDNFTPTTHQGTLTISAGVPLSSTAANQESSTTLEVSTFWLPGIVLASLVGMTRHKQSHFSRGWLILLMLAGTSLFLGVGACGSGKAASGGLPRVGTATIAIKATDSTQKINHTLNLTVMIQ